MNGSPSAGHKHIKECSPLTFSGLHSVFAESEGFKPPIPEEGIPDFESSAIDHSANSPSRFNGAKVTYFSEPPKLLPHFFRPSNRTFLASNRTFSVLQLHVFWPTKAVVLVEESHALLMHAVVSRLCQVSFGLQKRPPPKPPPPKPPRLPPRPLPRVPPPRVPRSRGPSGPAPGPWFMLWRISRVPKRFRR